MSAFLESLTGLRWLAPGLLLLAAVPLLALLLGRRGAAHAVDLGALGLFRGRALPRSLRQRLLFVVPLCQALCLACAILALARPAREVALPRERAGIDIFLCLDRSSSMAATDMDPRRSRLAIAREAAARFVEGRPDDRIGLLAFARFPDLVCPLTLDHEALLGFLDGLGQVEADGPEDLTGIGTAVARAAQLGRDRPERSKVVILLTDGEENLATGRKPDEVGPGRAGLLCRELGVRVYAISIGVGRRGPDGRLQPLDLRPIMDMAEATGGSLLTARDAGTVDAVYRRIGALESHALTEPRFAVEDRVLPLVLAALVLAVSRLLLQATWLEVRP
ncbi:MAG: VWA domain-containing protein [Planctomycetota bacterium]